MRSITTPSTISCAPRRGFTLVEVLVAIVILLVGVVAALQIFPRGYDAFVATQSTYTALGLLDKTIADLTEHPEKIPDAIYPLGMEANSAVIAENLGEFVMDDLSMLDYQGSTTTDFYGRHLYPVPGGMRWPLMQPRSVRVPRRIVGETCVIPSEITAVNAAGTATVAFMPKYLLGFGPAQLKNPSEDLLIYDLRYRKVTEERLLGIERLMRGSGEGASPFPDTLYYAADYSQGRFIFLPEAKGQRIRFTFYAIDPQTGDIVYVNPRTVDLPDSGEIAFKDTPLLKDGWRILPGSEQLNRAYRLTDAIVDIPSGHYAVDAPPTGDLAATNMLLGVIFFSKEDAGRLVKIDYTAADWNILQEEIAVDDEGYLRLSVADPKIRNIPNFPREPITWGLYGPMGKGKDAWATARAYTSGDSVFDEDGIGWICIAPHNSTAANKPRIDVNEAGADANKYWTVNTVMGLVDARTGVQYHVTVDNPDKRKPRYRIVLRSASDPEGIRLEDISMAEAQRGMVRIGRDNGGATDWRALRGKTYRVFYRARQDWTLQVFRAPAIFWQMSMSNEVEKRLGADKFALGGRDIYLPSLYEGQSVAIDYQYREEIARVSEYSGASATVVQVSSTARLAPGMEVRLVNPAWWLETTATAPTFRGVEADKREYLVTIASIASNGKITLDTPVTVYPGAALRVPDAPLLKVNGEMHLVPRRMAGIPAVSRFRLRQLPEPGTPIQVRGMSVTVRALWAQPRGATASVMSAAGKISPRQMNERWQGKSVTAILPATKE